jgi:hypothetical protein
LWLVKAAMPLQVHQEDHQAETETPVLHLASDQFPQPVVVAADKLLQVEAVDPVVVVVV